MVRRPAPILTRPRRRPGPGLVALGVPLVALAYFLAAPSLPGLPAGDVTVLVAGSIGLLMVAATTLSLLPARETLIGPLILLLGAGLVSATLDAADVGAGANVSEALLAAAIGLLFARWLRAPAVAIAVPLFVAAIDVWSVALGPSSRLLENAPQPSDALSFDMPAWGGHGSAGQLGLSDAIFLAMFAAWALHFGFRKVATIAALMLGLVASLVLSILLDRAIPALPLLSAGYLLANVDRIGQLSRQPPDASAPT